jgi:RNA polymerase primary sigma factor
LKNYLDSYRIYKPSERRESSLIITKQFTNRESKSLDQYLQEIGKVNLLTPDEEVDLAIKIRKGDGDAQEKLVRANLRFVVSVAKQFQNKGLSLGDLINEGNLGLIKAAQRFDETRGFKFISYAVWWIRQGIMSALANHQRVVRLPLNRVGELTKISKAYRDLEQEYERKPTTEELAKILEITAEEVAYSLQISGRYVSMDAPLKSGDENKNSLMDVLPNDNQPLPDNSLMKESLKNEVTNILSTLDAREAEVIRLSFGIGRNQKATLEEIGDRFNLTRERIRQIKEKALRKLRISKKSERLKAYL